MNKLDINGMVTVEDVTNMIKDTIDAGDLESAKDYLDQLNDYLTCLLYTSPSPRDGLLSRMPSSA